jgi:hypothetical protein
VFARALDAFRTAGARPRPVFCMLLEPNEWWVVREYTIASNNIHFWMGIKPACRLGLRQTAG